jgi:SAM-dependent methyltransferase
VTIGRYDGLADWYDGAFDFYRDPERDPGATLHRLVGSPPAGYEGPVLDVGCGTGLSGSLLEALGWEVGGIDGSADQLRVAGDRLRWRVRGDVGRLPFRSGSVPMATVVLVHTDVDDYTAVLAEVARVVAPGGTVVHLGVHPCFVGHHIESVTRSDDRLVVDPGYRDAGWVLEHPNFGPGVRGRIGARHVPLADLLNAVATAGLVIDQVVEGADSLVPWTLASAPTSVVHERLTSSVR